MLSTHALGTWTIYVRSWGKVLMLLVHQLYLRSSGKYTCPWYMNYMYVVGGSRLHTALTVRTPSSRPHEHGIMWLSFDFSKRRIKCRLSKDHWFAAREFFFFVTHSHKTGQSCLQWWLGRSWDNWQKHRRPFFVNSTFRILHTIQSLYFLHNLTAHGVALIWPSRLTGR